ncbi:MAG: hypothetical protein Ct9H300mP15_25550 [Gemmatimonadota bacterium]|nr:MAG: hypothetical protein Ct9H300mP15_25550 [Gemmatimonadota bacterium]
MRQFILLAILVLALTPVTSEGQVRLIIGGGLSQPNGDFPKPGEHWVARSSRAAGWGASIPCLFKGRG